MGRLGDAVATSAEALRVARAQGDPALVSALEQRLRAFEVLLKSGRPPSP